MSKIKNDLIEALSKEPKRSNVIMAVCAALFIWALIQLGVYFYG